MLSVGWCYIHRHVIHWGINRQDNQLEVWLHERWSDELGVLSPWIFVSCESLDFSPESQEERPRFWQKGMYREISLGCSQMFWLPQEEMRPRAIGELDSGSNCGRFSEHRRLRAPDVACWGTGTWLRLEGRWGNSFLAEESSVWEDREESRGTV